MKTNDPLPEPGENERGERYNDLPIGPDDFPDDDGPNPALGHTYGTGPDTGPQSQSASSIGTEELAAGAAEQNLSGIIGQVHGASAEDPFASSVPRSVEDEFGHSARPLSQSASETFKRKFGGR